MITNNELKYYSSLLKKKYRQQENKFLVEGFKSVIEGLNSGWKCESIFVTNDFINSKTQQYSEIKKFNAKLIILSNLHFQKISDTKTPQGIAAAFLKPKARISLLNTLDEKIIVYLDEISDPANVGAIMRNCDWFGITSVLMSKNCVEFTNSKVVRASMGSVFHLNIFEDVELKQLQQLKSIGYKFLVADVAGKSIFMIQKPEKIVIVFSNESEGPSQKILQFADDKITIPKKGKAESLNVASASAVILSQLT